MRPTRATITAAGKDVTRARGSMRAGLSPTVQEGAGGGTSRVLLWTVTAPSATSTRLERSGGTRVALEMLDASREVGGASAVGVERAVSEPLAWACPAPSSGCHRSDPETLASTGAAWIVGRWCRGPPGRERG
jgi:hypothetical protein